MNVEAPLTNYVERMLSCVRSHKVFYLDSETKGIVAQLLSSTEALERDVFLIHQLGVPFKSDANIGHLSAIVFVRPTETNIDEIVEHLKDPKHNQYFLFFSNQLEEHSLLRLAQTDTFEVVQQVQELYADFYPISRHLWTLNQENQCNFYQEEKAWRREDIDKWNRQVDGLAAFLLSVKRNPIIRYQKASNVAFKMSSDLRKVIENERDLFGWSSQGEKPLLLILDRREDPITPLLMQWTYQAMVHEILGIENSRVDMRFSKPESKEKEELIMNPFNDEFFRKHLIANYGEIANETQRLLKRFAARSQQGKNLKSIEDMTNFIENYPQFLAEQGNTAKHITIVGELSRAVKERKLMNMSELEQEMVNETEANRKEHLNQLETFLKAPKITDSDKLRLALIYVIRYEKSVKEKHLSKIRSLLRDNSSLKSRDIQLVNSFLRNYGMSKRGTVLFSDEKSSIKSVFQNISRKLTQVDGIDCVFTQHNPSLFNIIDNAIKGKLPLNEYPSINGQTNKESPNDIIIYVVGGATYEEALTVYSKNQEYKNKNIVLGGPCIHNSRTFIEDVKRTFVSALDTEDS